MSNAARVILAVDPGLMTGACRWFAGSGLEHGFQLPHLDFLDWAWASLQTRGHETVIVVEEYRINSGTVKKTPAPWSTETIGTLRWMARVTGARFEEQTAADAKAFITNERLRAAGCWFKGQEHARDAARHLLLYMARCGWYDGTTVRGPQDAG